ncbi:MAG: aminomethyl-transferring glycine dehydrogenase, partial [Promethearchaeota archaeon]
NSHYAMKKIGEIDGIKTPLFDAPHFKEFTVNVNETGVSIGDIQRSLLELGVHGGRIISEEFPEFGETSLFCVTEIHTKNDILKLVDALSEIAGGGV